jgi:TnpA family transposase
MRPRSAGTSFPKSSSAILDIRPVRAVWDQSGTSDYPRGHLCREAILDNATELAIVEPTTDTAGATDLVFTLFDLLRMQFAPRLRDIGDQQLYRMSREQQVRHLAPRVKGTLKQDLLLRPWDDFLRLAGSLKLGWVTASLCISTLQAYPRQNILTWALQEYGRLIKMLFILRYLAREDDRLWINAQLHTGESLHALREFLLVADKG